MSRNKSVNRLVRKRVGEIPLLQAFEKRLGFKETLERFIPPHGNEKISAADTLMMLVYNVACGRQPLYELDIWVQSLDSRMLDYKAFDAGVFNDDRFARALDKLHQ